ncbi:hypothetical protein [Pseudofrankia sp. BMG5.36]|uniref:hypothetical protein n=1 Tax=Pseudofrankia sp. BMG5.36 TaxID=1834512 RepID=UPI0032D58ED4
MEVTAVNQPQIARDADGIAQGGVRNRPVGVQSPSSQAPPACTIRRPASYSARRRPCPPSDSRLSAHPVGPTSCRPRRRSTARSKPASPCSRDTVLAVARCPDVDQKSQRPTTNGPRTPRPQNVSFCQGSEVGISHAEDSLDDEVGFAWSSWSRSTLMAGGRLTMVQRQWAIERTSI